VKKDLVKQELLRIAKEHGGELRAEVVVDAAKSKTSPLHDKFTWDDSEAAKEYRLWQARQLIVSVRVEYVGGEVQEIGQVFVSLTPDRVKEGGGYRVLSEVMTNSTRRQQLLEDAYAEMERFRQKYAVLKELAEVFTAMRKVTGRKKAA
jgi:hypothetical protein